MSIHDPIHDLSKDKLNAKSLATIILQRLTDDDCPPTLGLYGGWGTGKTSTLNLIVELNQLFQNQYGHLKENYQEQFKEKQQESLEEKQKKLLKQQELLNELIKYENNKNRLRTLLQDPLSNAESGSSTSLFESDAFFQNASNREITSSSVPLREGIESQSIKKMLHIEIIDAWQYDTTNNLLNPIIVRLMKSLKGLDSSRYNDWRVYAERVLEVTSLAASDAALRKLTGLTLKDVSEYKEKITKNRSIVDWEETVDQIEETNKIFTELVTIFLLQKKQQKLIICIDNLDRCSPENVVQLLESIKNYLAVSNCTWVFVMDNNLVSSYINRKYEGTNMDGNSYLDKIVPEQYHVIQPTHTQATDLLQGLLFQDIRLGDYAKISRFLIPRRLIKTAVKYEQTMKIIPSNRESNKDILFALILLYHGWPDFYEFLSSGDDELITGTLINFYPKSDETIKYSRKIPLPDIFETDKELIYYIQSAFYQRFRSATNLLGDRRSLEAHFMKVISCIRLLRYAGLP